MEPKAILITGANRGLGLEFVKQFVKLEKPPLHIFAACRDPDKAEVSVCYSSTRMLTEHLISIGGSRGLARRTPPRGPDSFVSTYKIFET